MPSTHKINLLYSWILNLWICLLTKIDFNSKIDTCSAPGGLHGHMWDSGQLESPDTCLPSDGGTGPALADFSSHIVSKCLFLSLWWFFFFLNFCVFFFFFFWWYSIFLKWPSSIMPQCCLVLTLKHKMFLMCLTEQVHVLDTLGSGSSWAHWVLVQY